MSNEYDNQHICPKCGGQNDYKVVESINLHPCEVKTYCTACGWKDYWAYGWYESRSKKEMNKLETINTKWNYKADKGDKWRVLDINKDTIEGDCEDYSLTVLYHFVCEGDWKKFLWYIVSGKASMWYVEVDTDEPNRGHAVMEVEHYGWIDNWAKYFLLTKKDMEDKFDHKFKYKFSRVNVLYRLLKGVL